MPGAVNSVEQTILRLVVEKGRSYEELAEVMRTSAPEIRDRAHRALRELVPGGEVDTDDREAISDYVLGQQSEEEAQATYELLCSSPTANEWALMVVVVLGPTAASSPDIPFLAPDVAEPPVESDVRVPSDGVQSRAFADPLDRPALDGDVNRLSSLNAPSDATSRRTSRMGGGVLLGLGTVLVIGVLVFVVAHGGSKDAPSPKTTATDSSTPAATATATATGTAAPSYQQVAQLNLDGAGGGKATGAMGLYTAQGSSQLVFQIAAKNVPTIKSGAYGVWLTGGDKSHFLGFAPKVTKNGQLALQGPQQADAANLASWLQTTKQVLVTRETSGKPSRPGTTVLSGAMSKIQVAATPTATATP